MTDDHTLTIDGVRVPRFFYGTAWKEDDTRRLTELALQSGFRGIDTANQRRHYQEQGVGAAVAAAIARKMVTREELFLQTKFTFRAGQDHRLPYEPAAPIATQVAQSFASSLDHLRVDQIDSFVLHGPSQRFGWGEDDRQAWQAMEALVETGRVRLLGVSNVTIPQLVALCDQARIPPRFVQNRCFAVNGWDREVRQFCSTSGIVYQGFSLLTANPQVLASDQLAQIASRHGRDVCQVVFRFALDVGMIPLTGTTSPDHMRDDLGVFDFRLTEDERRVIERLGVA